MISAMELLSQFRRLDIRLWVEDGFLNYSAPKGVFTAELQQRLAARKQEILQILSGLAKNQGQDLTIPVINRDQELPLSFSQHRLWFLDRMEGSSSAYNMVFALRLRGMLHIDTLRIAIAELCQRHESLRTSFGENQGQPVQVISQTAIPDLIEEELPADRDSEGETLLHSRIRSITTKPFDLSQAPLLRIHLIRCEEAHSILIFSMHHIISDGWSMEILVKELGAIYSAHLDGRAAKLPPLPIQYADYAHWQRQRLEGEEEQRQLKFWQERLNGLPPLLDLPTDRPRPPKLSDRGGQVLFRWERSLTEKLSKLASGEATSMFVVLLAAFQVLLSRYSGRKDVVVGSPSANRNLGEVEGVVGFFVNNLTLRTQVDSEQSFRELVQRVSQETFTAYQHQELPFERLVEAIQPERDLSHAPIAQIRFIMLEGARLRLSLPGLEVEHLELDNGLSKFDLLCTLYQTEEGLRGGFTYSTDLFEHRTILRMAQHFKNLLTSIVAKPSHPLRHLDMLTHDERKALLAWNAASSVSPPTACVHDMFEAQVRAKPEAPALIEGSVRYTYALLNSAANRVASALLEAGLHADEPVGLCVSRSAAMIAGLLGILKAGGAYVPIDPQFPKERKAHMVADAALRFILTTSAQQDAFQAHTLSLDGIFQGDVEGANPLVKTDPSQLAYIIYTSGSTGQPKGVGISHQALCAYVNSLDLRLGLASDASMTSLATMAADLGNTAIFGALCTGRPLHLLPEALHLDPAGLARDLAATPVDCLKIVPKHLAALLAAPNTDAILPRVCLVMGGDLLEKAQVRHLQARRPEMRIVNHYGPTETTIGILTFEVGAEDQGSSMSIPIGTPLNRATAYVLDPHLHLTPLGVPGELALGGLSLARGYHGQPGLTAKKFVPDPFAEVAGKRLYLTGDLVRHRSVGEYPGPIEFLGRIDNQIKIRGFRVELGEVESALKHAEGVHDALVVMGQDQRGEKHLIAHVIQSAGYVLNPGTLEAELGRLLPHYMVPTRILMHEQFPLTANGKVDYAALYAMVDLSADLIKTQDTTAPSSPLEIQLAGIWCEVLELETIGIHANFFKLGGHSLLATLILARLIETMGIHITVKDLFEHPTIAHLAQFLQQTKLENHRPKEVDPPPRLVDRHQALPLSLFQQRLWFMYKLDGPSCAYNIPAAFSLEGTLHYHALQASLETLVQRHEILRTHFQSQEREAIQVIDAPSAISIGFLDLEGLANPEKAQTIQSLAQREARFEFDLEQGPLLRIILLRTRPQSHVLLLTVHHIVFDGWSVAIFAEELQHLYAAQVAQRQATLPPLPLQYADFAQWQRTHFDRKHHTDSLDYWSRQLADLTPVLPLPFDYSRPAIQTYHGKSLRFTLPDPVFKHLLALGQQHQCSLFMTLMGAYQILLARLSGQNDIAVGFPSSNRPRKEFERLIGFFINTLILRTHIDYEETFGTYLEQVRRKALEAFSYQATPFENIVEALQPERGLSHAPFTQVRFMLRNAPGMNHPLPGLDFSLLDVESGVSRYDLQIALTERDHGLDGYLQYNADLFTEATAQRLIGYFQQLLQNLIVRPDRPLKDISILSDGERRFLMQSGNSNNTNPSPKQLAHQLMEAQAATRGQTIALTYGNHKLSYLEFNRHANRLAHYLQTQGVLPGTQVGICLERSFEMLIAMFAIMKTGAAFVPMEPNLPHERIAYMVENAGLDLLLTDTHARPEWLSRPTQIVLLDCIAGDLEALSDGNLPLELDPDHLAYVIFTSGSTGWPKGVGISHRALCSYVHGIVDRLCLPENATMAALASVAADLANTSIFGALCSGRTLMLLPRQFGEDPGVLVEFFKNHSLDALKIVPRHLAMLLRVKDSAVILPRQCLIFGGEPLERSLVEKIRSIAPSLRIINHYGPTETTVGILTHEIPATPPPYPLGIPIGRPLAHFSAHILDGCHMPAGLGVAGELLLGGPGLARGYLGKPGLTAMRFVPDPFGPTPGARLYRTGDLARRLVDGHVLFLGRVDHQVKIRGFRVEPNEVAAVLNRHPNIATCAVILKQDRLDQPQLVAFAVLEASGSARTTPDTLKTYLSDYLPHYMLPAQIVLLQEFPLTGNGKIDRTQLQKMALSEGQDEHQQDTLTPPRTEVEKTLVEIWREVLELEQVGIYHDFYQSGGHSLLAILIITRIREIFAVEVELRILYEYRTIASLAEFIEASLFLAEGQPSGTNPTERVGGEL